MIVGSFRILIGLAALIGAAIILGQLVRTQFIRAKSFDYSLEVCRGEYERLCRPHNFFIGCGSMTEWAQARCYEFSIVDKSYAPGGRCGYVIASVSCRMRLRP